MLNRSKICKENDYNFEDELYLDYLQQLERYPQRIFIDKGDPFNTLYEDPGCAR